LWVNTRLVAWAILIYIATASRSKLVPGDVSGVHSTRCLVYIVSSDRRVEVVNQHPQSIKFNTFGRQSLPNYRTNQTNHHEASHCPRRYRVVRARGSERSIPSTLRTLGPLRYLHHQTNLRKEGRFLRPARLHVLQRFGYRVLLRHSREEVGRDDDDTCWDDGTSENMGQQKEAGELLCCSG
jgi:hypothetical protein